MGAAVKLPTATAGDVNAQRVAWVADLVRRLNVQPRATPPAPVKLVAFLDVDKPKTETAETREQPQERKPKVRR